MTDMSNTILAKSDQLNADDLLSGPIVIKITGVSTSGPKDQPVSINYIGDNGRPWKPCKTMRRAIVFAWGADSRQYIGRLIQIYNDPSVKFGGQNVGGIRISHMSDIDNDEIMFSSNVSKGVKRQFKISRLFIDDNTKGKAVDEFDDEIIISESRMAATDGIESYKRYFSSLENSKKQRLLSIVLDGQNIHESNKAAAKAHDGFIE